MRSLLPIIFFIGLTLPIFGQSPHGEQLKMDCAACHTTDGWEIALETWKFGEFQTTDSTKFNHFDIDFALTGQHTSVNCKMCHESLIFEGASTTCIACHTDMHEQTVGSDCARCHSTQHWLVDDITELHTLEGFPLLGMHASVSCAECHLSSSELQFERIGNECINCHLDDFVATTNPDHQQAEYSTDCFECHRVDAFDWRSDLTNHDFFPLEKGHDIVDRFQCHVDGNFVSTPTECIACHQTDFDNALNPNHKTGNFSTDCAQCHSLEPGWMPAEIRDHDDEYFPIYSGEHQGEWDACVDCHNNPADYSIFTCVTCHQNPETDNEHNGVQGYVYESNACLACHPTGNSDDEFDHDKTNFPLTGAHIMTDCIECHAAGYQGTPTNCDACHQTDFNQTTNPNHVELNLSVNCASCHTTEPDWMPATFDVHDDFYPLNGAHAVIKNDCAVCHNGDYTNTPNTCNGCHADDYNGTTNPNHTALGFARECQVCHSETEWVPATFDHDDEYFPIFSGKHQGEWDACADCHTDPNNYEFFTCVTCHENPETDNQHNGISGYVYESNACLACHPTGDATDNFDHNLTNFPLTGAHVTVACGDCHSAGFQGTPTACEACHLTDFNQTTNPDHQNLGISTDCIGCHTTEPGWAPASFDVHDDYYVLYGGHLPIKNDCTGCHNGDYNNTPNTCVGCHQTDYNESTNPNHSQLGLSTDCKTCHTTNPDWRPATFDVHDNFYALNGAHALIKNDCAACHNGNYNNTPTTCFGCHQDDYNSARDPNHLSEGFPKDCESCHNESRWEPANFNHDQMYFPIYSGNHRNEWDRCVECHTTPGDFSTFSCIDCHEHNDRNDMADEHSGVNGYEFSSPSCFSCHPDGD